MDDLKKRRLMRMSKSELVEMVEKLQARRDRLLERQKKFREILDELRHGIIIDDEGFMFMCTADDMLRRWKKKGRN